LKAAREEILVNMETKIDDGQGEESPDGFPACQIDTKIYTIQENIKAEMDGHQERMEADREVWLERMKVW
jgi:hypothetical protein